MGEDLSNEALEHLDALAEKATPGERTVDDGDIWADSRPGGAVLIATNTVDPATPDETADRDLIAALDPDTVRALVRAVREARQSSGWDAAEARRIQYVAENIARDNAERERDGFIARCNRLRAELAETRAEIERLRAQRDDALSTAVGLPTPEEYEAAIALHPSDEEVAAMRAVVGGYQECVDPLCDYESCANANVQRRFLTRIEAAKSKSRAERAEAALAKAGG